MYLKEKLLPLFLFLIVFSRVGYGQNDQLSYQSGLTCGLNYATASVVIGQRFAPAGVNQPASLVISGLPACSNIIDAWLYCDAVGNGIGINASLTNPLGANAVFPMNIIGSDADMCQAGYASTYSYSIDVKTIISGNGTYTISGLPTSLTPPVNTNDVNGVTLLIVYSDLKANYAGQLVLFDGASVTLSGQSLPQVDTGFAACSASATAKALAIVSNLSGAGNDSISMNSGSYSVINGIGWNEIEQVSSVYNHQDTAKFNVKTTLDCYNLVLSGIYVQTTACTKCPVNTLGIITSSSPATCGNSNGSANIKISNGTTPYTYQWLPSGGTGATADNLAPGSYTINVNDNSGCYQATDTLTIGSFGTAVKIKTDTIIGVPCNGDKNGSAGISVSGGTSPYTYSWNSPFPNFTDSATNLAGGPVTITVNDKNNCTVTSTITIPQPNILNATIVVNNNVLCFGDSSGIATASPSGGTSPYAYTWSTFPVQHSVIATDLKAGAYSVTISDSKGCTRSTVRSITQPLKALKDSISALTNISCKGGNNGSATVGVVGGTSAYSYTWSTSPVQKTATANGLVAGSYTVTVVDANSCSTTTHVNLTEPPLLKDSISNIVNVFCFGGKNGSAMANPTGGSPGYTYSWSAGTAANTSFLNNVVIGTYSVTVTDLLNCQTVSTVTITQPSGMNLTISFTRNDACNGSNDGKAIINASGGAGGYTYSWNTIPVSTSDSAVNLSSGIYNVLVTDNNGCMDSVKVPITEPAPLTLSISAQKNLTCNGIPTGTATVKPAGGSSPYTYSWSTNPIVQTSATAINLKAGIYTILVTDNNGCTAGIKATITQPPLITDIISPLVNVDCKGNKDGSAGVVISGGVKAYTYSWCTSASGQTTAIATNLGAGNYSVVVTDNLGCTDSIRNIIVAEPLLALSGQIHTTVNVSCKGDSNGRASVNASGGTPGYVYKWSTKQTQTDTLAINLSAGTYTVSITDSKLCIATATVTITEPAKALAAKPVSSTNVLCFGSATGNATFIASGGTPGYNYQWQAIPLINSPGDSNLVAGIYTLVVTDTNNCFVIVTDTITQPTPMTLTGSSSPSGCGASNGSASVVAHGGTPGPGYIYSWNSTPAQTTATAAGVPAGIFVIQVTDHNACTQSINVVVKNSGTMAAHISDSINVACNGAKTGTAKVTATGGFPGYTYFWSTAPPQTTDSATNLSAGSYSVSVTDSHGCLSATAVTLTQSNAISIQTKSVTNISCNGGNNGRIVVKAKGGIPAYSYSWSTTPAQTTNTAQNLFSGTYTVTVTDKSNCTNTKAFLLTEPTVLTSKITGSTNINCYGAKTGSAIAAASGASPPYTFSWTPGGVSGSTASNLSAGTYIVNVSDNLHCTTKDTIFIAQNPVITLVQSKTNATCGSANGAVSVTATGGQASYFYSWAGGSTSDIESGLLAGAYPITVTDNLGCSRDTSVVIGNSSASTISLNSIKNTSCFGGSDGQAVISASGGKPPLVYSWSPSGGTQKTASGLNAGTYTIVVTDANNCQTASLVTITEPALLSGSSGFINNILCSGGKGSASIVFTGGTPGYTYAWSTNPVQTTDTVNAVTAGTYTLSVKDAQGCKAVQTTRITQPPALTLTGFSFGSACQQQTGFASVIAGGGVPGYSYSWNTIPAQTTVSAINIGVGVYQVQVTDFNSCKDSISVPVSNIGGPVITISSVRNITCNGGNNGAATITASSKAPPLTYTWSSGSGGIDTLRNNLPAGIYQVTVGDTNKCQSIAQISVTQPAPINGTALISNLKCFGDSSGSVSVLASGGNGGYKYSWNTHPSSTSDTISGLDTGVYKVVITDDSNCVSVPVAVTITQPPLLKRLVNMITNVSCNADSNGTATLSVSGGTPGYTYSWSGNPLQISNAASGLKAGTYTITIRDADNCMTSDTILITQPAVLKLTGSSISSGCNKPDGSANVHPKGGTPQYTYSWNTIPPQTTDSAVNLLPGTYQVQVTDSLACQAQFSVLVNNIPAPVLLLSASKNSTCNGGKNGVASVTASGGLPPLTYSWSPIGGSGTSADSLVAGIYSIAVTDSNHCITQITDTITQPAAISGLVSVSNVKCFGDSSGSISVIPSGGNKGYSYSWSTVPVQTGPVATGLDTGMYIVVIKDDSNCTGGVISVHITQPAPIRLTLDSIRNIHCNGGIDGFISVSATGGYSPYTWAWLPSGGTQPTASNLPAGNYTLTLSDSANCKKILLDTLTQPAPLSAGISGNSLICKGDSTLLTATKGIGYLWSNGDTVNPIFVKPTSNTPYSVQINVGGCLVTGIDTVKISIVKSVFTPGITSGPAPLLVNFVNQSLRDSLSFWSFGDMDTSGMTNPSHTYPKPGQYMVRLVVENTMGCTDTSFYRFINVDYKSNLLIPNVFSPNGDGVNDQFYISGNNISELDGEIFNQWGELMFKMDNQDMPWDGRTRTGLEAPAGTYFYVINATGVDGIRYQYKGALTLVR